MCPLRASQLGHLRFQHFLVHPELLTGFLTPFERQHLKTTGEYAKRSLRFYPASHPQAQQFTSLCAQANGSDNLLARCQMLQMAATILREELPKQSAVRSNGLTAKERFEQLMKRIPEADLQHLSPADLAPLCGCSVRHVSRQFRNYFGHSLVPKKTELRLQKAQQLLGETDAKVIDVAFESGFQHVGLFTTAFKKRFRVTPSEWRRRAQTKQKARA